jgi:hypothetical protein
MRLSFYRKLLWYGTGMLYRSAIEKYRYLLYHPDIFVRGLQHLYQRWVGTFKLLLCNSVSSHNPRKRVVTTFIG